MSRWEEERIRYYREKGIERQDLTERWTGDLFLAEDLAQADRAEQRQAQYEKVLSGRYNKKYREIREDDRAEYLKEEYKGRDQSMVARFRCGNEERANRYRKNKEENKCRLCEQEEETIEHLIYRCREVKKEKEITSRKVTMGTTGRRKMLDEENNKKEEG